MLKYYSEVGDTSKSQQTLLRDVHAEVYLQLKKSTKWLGRPSGLGSSIKKQEFVIVAIPT